MIKASTILLLIVAVLGQNRNESMFYLDNQPGEPISRQEQAKFEQGLVQHGSDRTYQQQEDQVKDQLSKIQIAPLTQTIDSSQIERATSLDSLMINSPVSKSSETQVRVVHLLKTGLQQDANGTFNQSYEQKSDTVAPKSTGTTCEVQLTFDQKQLLKCEFTAQDISRLRIEIDNHKQGLKELHRLVELLDDTIVRQWNSLLNTNDLLSSDISKAFDDLKARVDYFDKFGVDDALSQLQTDPDKILFLSPRWSMAQEDNFSEALYIRDTQSVNARYKFSKGVTIDMT